MLYRTFAARLTLAALAALVPTFAAADDIATVTIGRQTWLARNLAVTRFANGDPIPEVTGAAEWKAAAREGRPAQSAYANDPARVARDGLLYNYAAISDPRGLCPAGFRVPTDADWRELEATLGAATAATKLKTTRFWPDTARGSGNGTDEAGFGGLPAGFRSQVGQFFLGDRVAYFWSLTERSPSTTTAHMLFDYHPKIFRIEYDKGMGMSVRCLKT